MNITIKINTNNAAFEDNLPGEVARILAVASQRMLSGRIELSVGEVETLRDVNGNAVGTVWVEE